MSLGWYDYDGNPVSSEEWERMFQDFDRRQVAFTKVSDTMEVSTVWLGLDHRMPSPLFDGPGAPLIFETMIFARADEDLDTRCWRWSNKDAALAGHDQAVALARDAIGVRRKSRERS